MKTYDYKGLAGCVIQRHSRETGTLIGLYQSQQAGFSAEYDPWLTVCEDHGTICEHRTRALARHHMAAVAWCEICQSASTAKTIETDVADNT